MKTLLLIVTGFLLFSSPPDDFPKRCPSEWKGTIDIPGKTKEQIYKTALNWGMMTIGAKDNYFSDAEQGLFKARTKMPYMYRQKSYKMLYDLNLLAEDGKLTYRMSNCYIKAKPLIFWLEKYPYPDNQFDRTFESIYNNMNDILKDLSYTFQKPH